MNRLLPLTLVLAAVAAPAVAQPPAGDARWSAWLGCWDPTGPASTAHVCVTRAGEDGVLLRTTVEGQTPVEQTIVADGAEHPVSDADCRGTQRAEWSRTGDRLFIRAQLTCKDNTARAVSGISTFAADGTWLDIQAVNVGGRDSTRVRRYRRTTDSSATPAKRAAPLSTDDVKEASTKASEPAVEALLAESHAQFSLSGRTLTDLADAGLSPKLIDLMVALSYPKHFVVERSGGGPVVFEIEDDPYLLGWAFRCPGFAYCPDAYYSGLYPGYVYSPFAFGVYGDYYYDVGGPGGGGGGAVQGSGRARAINGQGYTRVRPRDDAPAQASVGTAGTGAPRTRSSTASASPQGYSSGGSSSGSSSGASSGGGSSGGGDTGRTAVPR